MRNGGGLKPGEKPVETGSNDDTVLVTGRQRRACNRYAAKSGRRARACRVQRTKKCIGQSSPEQCAVHQGAYVSLARGLGISIEYFRFRSVFLVPHAKGAKSAKEVRVHENEIARHVVDVAFQLHTKLGPGLLESVYQKIMAHELRKRGL